MWYIISHGLQNKIEEIFQEIQSSNMSKLGKMESQFIERWKSFKGS